MKCYLTSLCLLLTLNYAWADRFRSRIYEIERGKPHLVKMENGRVVFVKRDRELSKLMQLRHQLIEVEVGPTQDLLAFENKGYISSESNPLFLMQEKDPSQPFEPTVLPDNASASTIFARMNRRWQNDSQCYNRAHVWAVEEFNRTKLNSIKLFLFFTNRYIRNYRYKWWFHVSPMVLVQEGGFVTEKVLDRRFTRSPLAIKNWTRNFIYSGRTCPVINKYSEYRYNQQVEDCYLIPVTMYFWQPRDIDRFERMGLEKKSFIKSEVDWAYWEAF